MSESFEFQPPEAGPKTLLHAENLVPVEIVTMGYQVGEQVFLPSQYGHRKAEIVDAELKPDGNGGWEYYYTFDVASKTGEPLSLSQSMVDMYNKTPDDLAA